MQKKKMIINLLDQKETIRPQLYGHFIEHAGRTVNDGLFVGKNSDIPNRNGVRLDIIEAWKEMGVSLLHWPGGITSESYEWRKGVGDRTPNVGITSKNSIDESNDFGTDEFMDLCDYLGCDAYIVSGTLCTDERDLCDWVRYITSPLPCEQAKQRASNGYENPWKLPYLCIGNEWWFRESSNRYAEDFRRYSYAVTSLIDRATKDQMKIIARGPHLYQPQMTLDLISQLTPGTFQSVGFYIVAKPEPACSSSNFTEEDFLNTLFKIQQTDELIDTNIGIIRSNPLNKNVRLSIDEWGTWYQNEPEWLWKQSVTMRDALAVSQQLDIFNKHAADIEMASLCMSVNCLCCCIVTEGNELLLTPVFDVMKLYRQHQGGTLLGSWAEEFSTKINNDTVSLLSHSASKKDDELYITLSNASVSESIDIEITVFGCESVNVSGKIVTGNLCDKNSFEEPDTIRSKEFHGFTVKENTIHVTLPPLSLVALKGKL